MRKNVKNNFMTAPDDEKSFIKYETMDHLSDVRLKVYGKNIKDLFENAAEGMFSLISDLNNVKKGIKKDIMINIMENADPEDFLMAWLEKLLYICEVEGLLFSYFKIKDLKNAGSQNSISAFIKGERINPKKHEIFLQIKAPAYHNLHIQQDKKTGTYNVEIIFDV